MKCLCVQEKKSMLILTHCPLTSKALGSEVATTANINITHPRDRIKTFESVMALFFPVDG